MIVKIRNKIKNNKWIVATFFSAMFVISIIYILQKIAPFGNNSMLTVDLFHQYGPLLNELRDRLVNGESLLYSFNTGGGIPFYRNILNYLSSPFNILLLLFSKENIVMCFSIIIGLKICFAATTMSFFLKKAFKKDNIFICVFGLLYAFSGWFCAYYWNIMWLDGMIFLPLIIHGINKIIEEEKPIFYIVTLTIMIISNYFIAYMICLFSVLYFLGYFIYKNNFKLKNILRKFVIFFVSSFFAGALTAAFTVPLFLSLSSISATGDTFVDFKLSFNILDYIFNHISGVDRTVFASDKLPLPNMYPGLLSLVFVVLFFINRKINLRAKILSLIGILFFFCSFYISSLDFIWHAFHVPNDLPFRYSFVYTFVLVTIGYYSVLRLKDTTVLARSISFVAILALIVFALILNFENIKNNVAILCLILLVGYYIIFILFDRKRLPKIVPCSLLIIVVFIECIFCINLNWDINYDIDTFMDDKDIYEYLVNKAEEKDNDLYRIEKTSNLTLNDPAWYDYKGISGFSSMAYEGVAKFQRKIGSAGNNINSYYYKEYQTPIYNTMFNIKYILGLFTENNYYKLIGSRYGNNLNIYNYSSSLAYSVSKDLKDWSLVEYDPFLNQSKFVSLTTGVNDVYEDINVVKVEDINILEENYKDNTNGYFNYELIDGSYLAKFYLDNKKIQNIYLYIGGSNVDSFSINGRSFYISSDEYYTVDIGKFPVGLVEVNVNFNSNENSSIMFYAYSINKDKFKEFYSKLEEGFLKVKNYSDTYINGEISAKENQIVFTTVAYDKGWSVFVDGKKVETEKIADSYLAFDITEGNHEVIFKYSPPGMIVGIIISSVSMLSLIGYSCFLKKDRSFSGKN